MLGPEKSSRTVTPPSFTLWSSLSRWLLCEMEGGESITGTDRDTAGLG